MDDKTFIKNMAAICEELLKASGNAVVDFGRLNDTLIEINKRACVMGMKRKDLYPNEKK